MYTRKGKTNTSLHYKNACAPQKAKTEKKETGSDTRVEKKKKNKKKKNKKKERACFAREKKKKDEDNLSSR